MYRAHYQLKKKPFELTPDPDFIWLKKNQIEAVALLKRTIQHDAGIHAFTGDVGTGKTTLLNYLLQALGDTIVVANIAFPDLDEPSFFEFIADEFKMPGKNKSKGAFLFFFDQFLRELSSQGRSAVIIIDDAQIMSPQISQTIRFLSNLKIDGKKLVNILLMGQSENREKFREKIEREIQQTIKFIHHLEALTKSDTQKYIRHRLEKAGATNVIFKPQAIDEIYLFSAGCPRMINIICDHALLAGYAGGIKEIKESLVKKCIKDLNHGEV